MLKVIAGLMFVLVCSAIAVAWHYGMIFNQSPTTAPLERSMYDFEMIDIDGNVVKLDRYKGNVTMIVNTASQCGLTPQYEGLQQLYDRYKDKGFVVLGFPANNFLGQEPGTEAEIKEFCTLKYNVSFPMFSKISVTGEDQHPFYTFLTHASTNPGLDGDITWNFEKFISDRHGKISARFSPKTLPTDESVISIIETLLAEGGEAH